MSRHTVRVDRGRVKDWLIGAAATVLLLVLVAAVFWWTVSEPSGTSETEHVPSPQVGDGPPSGDGQPPGGEPPADLAEDEVWLADLALDAGTVVAAGSTLHDVQVVARAVVTGPQGLVAARATVDATVPFVVVAAELGEGTEVRAGDRGEAVVVRTVDALGRELRVVATGTVEVEAGKIVVEPSSIDIGGPDFLSRAIAAVVRGLVSIEHEIEGLPEGLVLEDVTVRDDGFRANLQGEDVRLVQ